ncbi:MAG: sensor histidine kinase [Bacteroidota bacterium]|nr:sensor histidine kinase [Bacteroidota bacterium]
MIKSGCFIVVYFFIYCFAIPAQTTNPIIDSLVKLLPKTAGLNKVIVLSDLSYEYMKVSEQDKCKTHAQQELDLALKLNDPKSISSGYNDLAIAYWGSGNMILSLDYNLKALAIREKLGDSNLIASSISKIANVYINQTKYAQALEMQLRALRIFEQQKNIQNVTLIMGNIGELYRNIANKKLSYKYFYGALMLARKNGFKLAEGTCIEGIGKLKETEKNFDTAIILFKQSAKIFEDEQNYTNYNIAMLSIGRLLKAQFKNKEALAYYLKAYQTSAELGDSSILSGAASNLGTLFIRIAKPDEALPFSLQAKEICEMFGYRRDLISIYKDLGIIYTYKRMDDSSEYYWNKHEALADSLYTTEQAEKTMEFETKFQTEKKEKLLAEQDLQLSKRNTLIISLCSAIILVVLGWLLYNYRIKAKQQTEKIHQKELQSKAIIEAEERERVRIAKDLHDGVGQLLAAARMQVSGLSAIFDSEDISQKTNYDNALSLLDESAKEVRAVSHSMIPNALIRKGLSAAVREFVDRLVSDKLKVDLELVGLDKRLDSNTETVLYRVLQEIISNVVRHSGANYISIQFIKHDTEVVMMVEDNGKGFDLQKVLANEKSGIGLRNIQSRVDYLNGSLEFDTIIGRGTTVTVQVPVI